MIVASGCRPITFGLIAVGLAFVVQLASTTESAAQVRGLPTFFEPSFGYDTRFGVDAGWWGEVDGTTLSVNAAHQIYIGNCHRVAVGAYVNANNTGGGPDMLGGAALSTAVMVLPCPTPTSIVNPSLWIVGGAGTVSSAGAGRMNAVVGLGAGYLLDEFAVVKIEPHATAAIHYRESLADPDDSSWKPDVSLGLNLGVGANFGFRTAVGCCYEGVSYTIGLSLWE